MTDDPVDVALAQIDEALEGIRPYIASHRGSVEVIDFDPATGVVYVRLGGTCHGCSAASYTLKHGIEQRLRRAVPSITAVESI